MSSARYRLGVDVGGTHTDFVLLDNTTGELSVEKVASTPNPALGVLEGVGRFIAKGIPPSQIGFFAHGTTITTQRAVGDARRQGRIADHAGLPRGAGNSEPSTRRQLV